MRLLCDLQAAAPILGNREKAVEVPIRPLEAVGNFGMAPGWREPVIVILSFTRGWFMQTGVKLMHTQDLSPWTPQHVVDEGNPLAERGTRLVIWSSPR